MDRFGKCRQRLQITPLSPGSCGPSPAGGALRLRGPQLRHGPAQRIGAAPEGLMRLSSSGRCPLRGGREILSIWVISGPLVKSHPLDLRRNLPQAPQLRVRRSPPRGQSAQSCACGAQRPAPGAPRCRGGRPAPTRCPLAAPCAPPAARGGDPRRGASSLLGRQPPTSESLAQARAQRRGLGGRPRPGLLRRSPSGSGRRHGTLRARAALRGQTRRPNPIQGQTRPGQRARKHREGGGAGGDAAPAARLGRGRRLTPSQGFDVGDLISGS